MTWFLEGTFFIDRKIAGEKIYLNINSLIVAMKLKYNIIFSTTSSIFLK